MDELGKIMLLNGLAAQISDCEKIIKLNQDRLKSLALDYMRLLFTKEDKNETPCACVWRQEN